MAAVLQAQADKPIFKYHDRSSGGSAESIHQLDHPAFPGDEKQSNGTHGSVQLQQDQSILGHDKGKLREIRDPIVQTQLYQPASLYNNQSSGINGSVLSVTSNPVWQPPPSNWKPLIHPRYEETAREVDDYFLQHWSFQNPEARKKFVAAGFSRVTCLYFPLSKDDRIHFACRLLTVLFLIDGKSS